MPQEDSSMELASKKLIVHISLGGGGEEKNFSIHLFIFLF